MPSLVPPGPNDVGSNTLLKSKASSTIIDAVVESEKIMWCQRLVWTGRIQEKTYADPLPILVQPLLPLFDQLVPPHSHRPTRLSTRHATAKRPAQSSPKLVGPWRNLIVKARRPLEGEQG